MAPDGTMTAPRKCEDWQCPSKWSCAHALCRSYEYWAMVDKPLNLFKGDRRRYQDACADYERDQPREWMKDAFRAHGAESAPTMPDGWEGLHIVRN